MKKYNIFLNLSQISIPAVCSLVLTFAGSGLLVEASPASAQTDQDQSGFWTRSTLLGDMGGLRPALEKYGISLDLQEISEVLGNVRGGTKQGAVHAGVTTLDLTLDTAKAFHWQGGTFYVNALQIHGGNLSAENLDNLQTVSGIEVDAGTRLWELWYQQKFLNDNPPGGPFNNDSTRRGSEAYGTRFNLSTGALFIAEIQYAAHQSAGAGNNRTRFDGLPGTYKLGAWCDTAGFPDQRFDKAGLSLADPESSGIARMNLGNFSIYGIVDQTVWRETQGPRSVSVFARIMGAPADRNLIDFSLNAGVNMKSPLPGRNDDTFGIGYGLAHVSDRAGDVDRDTRIYAGTASYPVRGNEHFVEVAYQYQVTSWWQLQPDFPVYF